MLLIVARLTLHRGSYLLLYAYNNDIGKRLSRQHAGRVRKEAGMDARDLNDHTKCGHDHTEFTALRPEPHHLFLGLRQHVAALSSLRPGRQRPDERLRLFLERRQ